MSSKQFTLADYAEMDELLDEALKYFKARRVAILVLKEFCSDKHPSTEVSLAAAAQLLKDKVNAEEYRLLKSLRELKTCREISEST